MTRAALRWILAAAITAAFLSLCAALDGNDQYHGYPATMAMASHVP